MIERLLIANRGEIARRIIRTARAMGIECVAVYSEADAHMPFVAEADKAVCIGPAPARESYLVADRIIAAARETGAQAIHPGYGFLSENAEFAEAVAAAGLIWIGAPPAAIRAMGLKDAAKRLMAAAGVPVTPGYWGTEQGDAHLQEEADSIGYPVLIKAVAGGGGKGMRRVDAAADFAAALDSCRREARASFGDDRVLIEKYVQAPRHIEVQIFGDTHGAIVHLFERDCSLQRRHQKVIEEAPAPGMDATTRAAICDAAVTAARAVNYVGAGTVEFIADARDGLRADRIWFMEMNTRLQVEHPVTEAITGQDLVEWQIRVAAGEALPMTQADLSISGWAMEARLYAENPATGFLPSIGPLTHFRMPDAIRVDSGVAQGGEISPHYDPMIAKLVAHAPTRVGAAAKLAAAARDVQVWPVRTNAAFLARTLADPDFRAARIDTGFIERHADRLIPPQEPAAEAAQAAARALVPPPSPDPWRAIAGFRVNAAPENRVALELAGEAAIVPLGAEQGSAVAATVGAERVVFADGMGWAFGAFLADHGTGDGIASDGAIMAPMPGRIVTLDVTQGDTVTRGQRLMILEAMKMEHSLIAPFDGIVAALSVVQGGQASEGMLLARIERGEQS